MSPLTEALLHGSVRRTVWLMLGAAIGLAAVLVAVGIAQLVASLWPSETALLVVASLLLIPLIGLIPGVRELEVTAGRSLLQPRGDLVVPEPLTAQHRGLTVLWATLHLIAGLMTGLLLLGVLPAAVAVGVAAVGGRPIELAGRVLVPELASATGRIAVLVLALAAVVVCLTLVWLLGRCAARAVPRFLGPTAQDRLVLAEARLAAEAEHARLARELHDGIGHALTIITVQAAGGRRGSDPARARAALAVVEETARHALTELDAVLGLLRDGGRRPGERGLADVGALVTGHRRAGLNVTVDEQPTGELPTVVSTTAYRLVAEALSNAQRYSAPGPVLVSWRPVRRGMVVEVSSPLPTSPLPRAGSGQGLRLVRERVELLGGDLQAAPQDQAWVVRAELPTGGRRA